MAFPCQNHSTNSPYSSSYILLTRRASGLSLGSLQKAALFWKSGSAGCTRSFTFSLKVDVVWQKSNETDFLLTMDFILFTNQGYPLRNSSLGQLHSDGGVVSIVRSSAGRLLLEYLSARQLRPFKWFLSRGNKKKSQGLRSGE